jgi:hypothetical protein
MRTSDHLTFVRSQGCVVRGSAATPCFGPIEAHHVRTAANSGMGMKPPNSAAVGLCALHHRALHTTGRRTFETKHRVDLMAEARRLAAENAPATPQQEPTMSDTAIITPPDATLELLREREHELELEVLVATRCLATLRDVIAQANARRPKAPRRLRTPEAAIAASHAVPGPVPSVTLDAALAGLGRVVAERDAEHAAELEAA